MTRQSFPGTDYYKAINLEQDPFDNCYSEGIFFLTPELQQRIDLITHLLQFSEQMLYVNGPQQVGKTFLCAHLMAKASRNWLICRLDADEELGPDTLVKQMLNGHLQGGEGARETIAALNAYLEFCNVNEKVPVLFVDNAEKLNDASLRFIFKLAEFKEHETYIRVALFGAESLSQRLSEMAEDTTDASLVHTVSIPALSTKQTAAYLQHRVMTCGGREDMFSDKEASRIQKVAAGLPGDINYLARQGLIDPAQIGGQLLTLKIMEKINHQARQSRTIIFGGSMALLVVCGIWFLLEDNEEQDIETLALQLPPESPRRVASVTKKTAGQPVAPATDNSVVADTGVRGPSQAVASGQTSPAGGEPDPSDAEIVAAVPESAPLARRDVVPSNPLSGTAKVLDQLKDHDWLLAQPGDRFVLQLISGVETATILRFLKATRLDHANLALYKARQAGKDWHVLVYGLFTSRDEAKAAISTLSAQARAENPWPKAMSSIHKAITSSSSPEG